MDATIAEATAAALFAIGMAITWFVEVFFWNFHAQFVVKAVFYRTGEEGHL